MQDDNDAVFNARTLHRWMRTCIQPDEIGGMRWDMQPHLFEPDGREVVFDVETQRSFQEVGGRRHLHQLGISVAVMYDINTAHYHTYEEKDLRQLVDQLLDATRIIGFNIKHFDYPVLNAYCPEIKLRKLPTLDLMEQVTQHLGFRVSLDNLAKATLNHGKTANGLDAVRWYQEGRLDLIATYCRDDVRVTWELYEFGKKHAHVKFTNKAGTIGCIPVAW